MPARERERKKNERERMEKKREKLSQQFETRSMDHFASNKKLETQKYICFSIYFPKIQKLFLTIVFSAA